MLELKLHTCIVVAHLIGLGLGVGGALITDGYVVRNAILSKIKPGVEETVSFLAGIVTVGLVLLWISGIALTAELLMTNPNFVNNEKFWAKVAIVVILTVNGLSIHHNILPLLRKQQGRRLFDGLDSEVKVFLAASGSISGVSWILPVLLGSAKEMSYVTPFEHVMAVYCVALVAMTAIALTMIERFVPKATAFDHPAPRTIPTPATRRRTIHDLESDYAAAWPTRQVAKIMSSTPDDRFAAEMRASAPTPSAHASLNRPPNAMVRRPVPSVSVRSGRIVSAGNGPLAA
ncbi:MAG: hypothetical protein K2Y05_08475 [Hyphomicrobiaceae bacterium]|nr:hypothetical protein [Hyphomicrobiaceae bacterium]